MKTVISILLFVLVACVFFPSSRHDFIIYDDPGYFLENDHVLAGLTWPNVQWAFQTSHLASWYPLTWLSFMLDATLFGKGPTGPHVVNVLLHAANTVLLFQLLLRLTGANWRSALVAALFALHPLHVESVAWIAERKDVLSTFFGLLTLSAYASYVERSDGRRQKSEAAKNAACNTSHPPPAARRSALFYWLAVLFFTCGLLSKPMLVTLPCAMLLLDHWPLQRLRPSTFWRLAVEKIPFFVLGLTSSAATVWVHHESGALSGLATSPMTARIANAFVSYARYLGKTFWPTELALPYPNPGEWPTGLIALAVALVTSLSLAALWFGRRRPYVFVGWFWFLIMLGPVIGLMQWGTHSMADRFTYIPLIGLFILIAWAAGEVLGRFQVPKWACATTAALALGACAARTENQLRHWQNSESLFRHALSVTTANYVAHDELGEALAKQGKIEEARAEFSAALRIKADYAPSLSNMSKLLYGEGKFEAAAALLGKLLASHPNNALTHCNLAMALARQGKTDEAIPHYHEAIRLEPDRAEVLNNLAWLLATHPSAGVRDGTRAVSLAERACELTGHTNLWFLSTLAAAYAEKGSFPEAVKTQQKVCDFAATQVERGQTELFERRLEMYRSGQAYRVP